MKTNYLISPIGRTLLFKSIPIFLGIFANIAYNLADTFFIAKLGTLELAAMSFSFPIIMIVLNMMMGIGTAINSLSSRLVGQKANNEAKQVNSQGLLFTILVSLALTILGLCTIPPLFQLLGVDQTIMPFVKEYMFVWFSGMILMNITIIAGAIFRVRGQVIYPSIILIAGAILNAILDPILIFGWGPIPSLGIRGAAWTTLLGNGLSAFLLLWKLLKKGEICSKMTLKCFRQDIHRQITKIAFPTALANSLVPISTACTNWILVSYGNAAVAANAIATRIETIPFIAIFALCSVLAPFVGQNFGANNMSRIREGIKKTFAFSYILGALCSVILIWFAKPLVALFESNPLIIAVTQQYFSFIPLTYGVLGTVFLTAHVMNAVGKPYLGNLLSSARLIFAYLPLAFVLNHYFEIAGIFSARVIANLLTGLLATILIYRTFFISARKQEEI